MGILDKFSRKKPSAAKGAKKADAKAKEAPAADASAKGGSASGGKAAQTRGPLAKDSAGEAHRVLVRPLFTEKSDRLAAAGKYSFIVAPGAGKVEVAAAVRDLYGVKPASVRIIVAKGKNVRFGRTHGREKDLKKAIVTLPPGQTLTVLEGV